MEEMMEHPEIEARLCRLDRTMGGLLSRVAELEAAARRCPRATGRERPGLRGGRVFMIGQVWRRCDGEHTGPCFRVDAVDLMGVATARAGIWHPSERVLEALVPAASTMLWPDDVRHARHAWEHVAASSALRVPPPAVPLCGHPDADEGWR